MGWKWVNFLSEEYIFSELELVVFILSLFKVDKSYKYSIYVNI